MNTMVIMRGLPGSGKSTAVETVVKGHQGCVVLSTDDCFMSGDVTTEMCPGFQNRIVESKYLWSADGLSLAHQLNQLKAEVACARCINLVVIDNTNTTWKEIKNYVALADNYNYRVELHSASTPWCMNVDECWKMNTHNVPLEAIRKMKARFASDDELQAVCKYHFPSVECVIS